MGDCANFRAGPDPGPCGGCNTRGGPPFPLPILRGLAAAYVSVFRGTPCLVQLFILYFGGPQVGINLEPFAAGVIGLGLNIGAYMSDRSAARSRALIADRRKPRAPSVSDAARPCVSSCCRRRLA